MKSLPCHQFSPSRSEHSTRYAASFFLILLASFLLSATTKAEQISLTVIKAEAEIYELNNSPAIAVQLTDASARDFGKFTEEHLRQQVLFRIDNKNIDKARIVTAIFGGKIYLTDLHDLMEAEKLADRLNAGVPLVVTTLSDVPN